MKLYRDGPRGRGRCCFYIPPTSPASFSRRRKHPLVLYHESVYFGVSFDLVSLAVQLASSGDGINQQRVILGLDGRLRRFKHSVESNPHPGGFNYWPPLSERPARLAPSSRHTTWHARRLRIHVPLRSQGAEKGGGRRERMKPSWRATRDRPVAHG